MKKLLSILALALCFVACQNEPNIGAKNSDLANVVLNIEAPELATRADADANAGKNSAFGAIDFFNDADWANYDVRYILEVYDVNDNGTGEPIYRERLVKCLDKYAPTTFNLRLVPNRDYKFVVFADFVEQGSEDDLYYDTTDLNNITAKTGAEGWNAMNEVRDAYFVSQNVKVEASLDETLTLKRPFGKVRVIATDLDYIAGYSKPGYVEITYHTEPLYKSFNAVNGNLNNAVMAGEELTHEYTVDKKAPYTEGYDANAAQQTLFADYLFAREGQQMPINFTMDVYESKGGRHIKSTNFNTQIPVQRNHLTTITGDILTTQANITIVVDDNFEDEFVNASMEVVAAPAVTATVNGNAVTLAWEAVEGAAKYYTRLAAEGNLAEETTELTKVYENLEWETEYTFEVYATSEKGLVSDTTVVKATTDKKPVVPALATPDVKAVVNGNIVTLTWNEIEEAAYYTVQVNDAEEELVNDTTYEFTGDYETEYTFAVKAITADNKVNLDSEAAVVKATTEANVAGEFQPEASEWALVGIFSEWADRAMFTTIDADVVVLENVDMKAAEGFLVRKPSTEWADKYGAGAVNYIKADHFITTTKDGADMCVEADGTYDVYFNISTKNLYVMVAGTDYTNATEQTVSGEEPKQEEPEVTEKVVYLQPNDNWKADNARFAAYFWNDGGSVWVSMTAVEEGIYEAHLPTGYDYGCNVIFCRMNPSTTANNWNNKWNQTADLKVPTDGTNLYTVKENTWDNGGGTWSTYTPAVVVPVALATPVVKAEVEDNTITLTWEAIENAAQYGITVGTEMPVFVEETNYVFTGEYETEYTFNVVAVPADEEKFSASEAAVVTATTKAEPAEEVVYTTVADFLAAAEDDTIYTLKGTITAVANTSYGNFDLTDDTGTVYIYGLCSPDGATQKYWATSGAKLGDDIVIKTVRTSFNGTAQGKNAWFVELVSPGTRAFYTVDPAAVDFVSAGGEQDIEVFAYNTTAGVTATSDNAAFAVNVNGYVVTVTAAANELEEAVTGNITIKVGDLEPTVVKATLAAKPASGAVEGGSDDFHTISATNTSYVSGKTTAGWNYKNCAIFKGGASDSSPAFKMIGDAANRALCMNGKTSGIGSITSPTLTTGCGNLKFNYGLPFSDTKIKFRVDIMQDGAVVKTFTVDKSSATKCTLYSHEEVINVAGEFQIVFTNLCPSNSTSNKDRTAIWDVEWTGYNN